MKYVLPITSNSIEGNEPDVATKLPVILCENSKPNFLAVLDETGGDTVHGIMLKLNEKRFLFKKFLIVPSHGMLLIPIFIVQEKPFHGS